MDQTKVGIEEPAENTEVKDKVYKKVLNAFGVVKTEKLKGLIVARCQSVKFIPWVVRATIIVLLWVCALQLRTLGETMGPTVLKGRSSSYSFSLQTQSSTSFPPPRIYTNNGFLMVSANGGLNQMRTGICDMVAIARYLNVTLIVPELDNTSFWNDHSEFKDIFDVNYFIRSLRDEVRILKELPLKQKKRVDLQTLYSFPPVSWSNMSFYFNTILPRIQKYELLHFTKTDTRLANNGLPLELQKLRCRVNYNSLRFTRPINDLGKKIVRILRRKGPFLALHLRYEMDMLAFSGCTEGCTENEGQELTKMRYAYTWWKEKEIDSDKKRAAGSCPLTPEETALALQALDIDRNIQIYIAAGDIYGGRRRLASLAAAYPNLVKKETLLKPSELEAYQNHSNQMAALDYLVALESDIFVPSYGGNMARVVEGHRRYLGFRTTINLDRKHLVGLIDMFRNGTLTWNEFSTSVKAAHANRMGKPTTRVEIQGKPKEEDYFYTNPQECLPPVTRS